MVDKETGRGRGFGFAEFATAQGATEAVGAVSGASMGGRVVRSEIAAPRPAGSGGSGRRDDRRRDDHRRRD
jgi:RNA recognition motif-containing protein